MRRGGRGEQDRELFMATLAKARIQPSFPFRHSRHVLSGIHLVFSQSTSIVKMERGTCVYPKYHVHPIFCEAGSRPGSRGPFLSAKGPKTMLAVAWSFGCLARFADTGGAKTRYAQTMRTFSPVSAVLLGLATRPVFLNPRSLGGEGG